VKKFGFSSISFFRSVRMLSFNAIRPVIKKMFHKGPRGQVRNGVFYFGIFFNETWHICRWGHEKIITWKFHWNRQRNKRWRASSVQNLYLYGKCTHWVQENVILHYKFFYFGKICAETWNFSLPKKKDLRKNSFFAIGPVVFAPRTQTYATELNKWKLAVCDVHSI
jgi:hypothetical protein